MVQPDFKIRDTVCRRRQWNWISIGPQMKNVHKLESDSWCLLAFQSLVYINLCSPYIFFSNIYIYISYKAVLWLSCEASQVVCVPKIDSLEGSVGFMDYSVAPLSASDTYIPVNIRINIFFIVKNMWNYRTFSVKFSSVSEERNFLLLKFSPVEKYSEL